MFGPLVMCDALIVWCYCWQSRIQPRISMKHRYSASANQRWIQKRKWVTIQLTGLLFGNYAACNYSHIYCTALGNRHLVNEIWFLLPKTEVDLYLFWYDNPVEFINGTLKFVPMPMTRRLTQLVDNRSVWWQSNVLLNQPHMYSSILALVRLTSVVILRLYRWNADVWRVFFVDRTTSNRRTLLSCQTAEISWPIDKYILHSDEYFIR